MSEGNGTGVVRIGRKGIVSFALGDGEPVRLDVIDVQNQWLEIDQSYRDAEGNVPREKQTELNVAAWRFVREVFAPAPGQLAEGLSLAEALEFLAKLAEEGDKLKAFFVPKFSEERSSPGKLDVTFSA
jgi:hypothetical protein